MFINSLNIKFKLNLIRCIYENGHMYKQLFSFSWNKKENNIKLMLSSASTLSDIMLKGTSDNPWFDAHIQEQVYDIWK